MYATENTEDTGDVSTGSGDVYGASIALGFEGKTSLYLHVDH